MDAAQLLADTSTEAPGWGWGGNEALAEKQDRGSTACITVLTDKHHLGLEQGWALNAARPHRLGHAAACCLPAAQAATLCCLQGPESHRQHSEHHHRATPRQRLPCSALATLHSAKAFSVSKGTGRTQGLLGSHRAAERDVRGVRAVAEKGAAPGRGSRSRWTSKAPKMHMLPRCNPCCCAHRPTGPLGAAPTPGVAVQPRALVSLHWGMLGTADSEAEGPNSAR